LADGSPALAALLRFALFAAFAIVAPGVGLQRLARARWDPALVVPLGLVACAFAYWLSLVSGLPLVFPGLLLAAGAGALLRPWLPRAAGPSLRGAALPIAVLVALFAITQYRVNRVGPSGAFLLDVGEHVDTALHVGLSFELVAGYPPQVPGLAGVPMHYHVASHLVRAAAARWAGIHPYDAMNRFDITLWAVALVLALRAAAAATGLGRAAVAAAGFVPLASDLSFIPGLLRGAEWWAQRLGDNFLEPIFFANSITPAVAIALAAIVALARAEQGEGRGPLALAALLAAAAGFFKVFTGAQLVLALGLAWLVVRGRALLAPDRRRLLVVLVPAGLALVALALSSRAPAGVAGVSVALVPFAAAGPALRAFGFPALSGAGYVLAGLAWLVLSLGLRVAGIPQAWRALRAGSGARCTLAALALSGWPLALFFRITADPGFDESSYFLQASGLCLWLFAAQALAALARRSRLAVAALVVALALPSSVELVARKASQPGQPIAPAAVAAMSALRAASCPGDVVITRPLPTFVPLPVVLAGRRVAFSNYLSYWQQFVSPQTLAERDRLLRSFFRSRTPQQALATARALHGRYLYLTGRQKVDFETTSVLQPLFERDSERVYRIISLAPAGCRGEPPRP
jgi:hypothetical protein